MRVQVKLVSHFWDDAALTLLSCERDVYTSIGQHPNIIRVYAQGMGEIPESMQELLPQEMTEVRLCPVVIARQCGVCHNIPISAMCSAFPHHILWSSTAIGFPCVLTS